MADFQYRGHEFEELKTISMEEFINLLPARKRRSLERGFSDRQRKLIQNIRKMKRDDKDEIIRTHCRDLIILPEMVGAKIAIHDGNDFNIVEIEPGMIGHYLGEFAMTRGRVKHSAPGVGATRSSMYVPLR